MTSETRDETAPGSGMDWISKDTLANFGFVGIILTAVVNFFGKFFISNVPPDNYALLTQGILFALSLVFILAFRLNKIKGTKFQKVIIVLINAVVLCANSNGLQSLYSGVVKEDQQQPSIATGSLFTDIFSPRPWIVPRIIKEELMSKDLAIDVLRDSISSFKMDNPDLGLYKLLRDSLRFSQQSLAACLMNSQGSNNSTEQLESLLKENQKLKVALDIAEQKLNVCRNNQNENATSIESLNGKITELQELIRRSEQKLKDCVKRLDELNDLEKRFASLKRENASLQDSLKAANRSKDVCLENMKGLKKEVGRLRKESSNFKDQSVTWYQSNLQSIAKQIESY